MTYVIIVNWNGVADTIACLASLRRAAHQGLTVVVCDNASSDGSPERLSAWADRELCREPAPPHRHPQEDDGLVREARSWSAMREEPFPAAEFRLVLISLARNLGFAGGNNVGIRLALADPGCSNVFLLNNDTEVMPDTIDILERKMARSPDIVICGATLVYFDDRDRVQGIGCIYSNLRAGTTTLCKGMRLDELPSEDSIEGRIEFVIGAAMVVRPEFFRRTGGLSEAYFLYYEELDLSQQLRPGERIGWARDAIVAHKVGGSIGTGTQHRPSDLSLYYDQRSRMRFYWTHRRFHLPFLAAAIARTMLAYLRKRDMRAVHVVGLALADFLMRDETYRRPLTTKRRAQG